MQPRNRTIIRQKSINREVNETFADLKKEYTVGQMKDYIKKQWGIEFHNIEYGALKTKAVAEKSVLLDIAADIKELLTDSGTDKYVYIDVLLTEFKKEMQAQ